MAAWGTQGGLRHSWRGAGSKERASRRCDQLARGHWWESQRGSLAGGARGSVEWDGEAWERLRLLHAPRLGAQTVPVRHSGQMTPKQVGNWGPLPLVLMSLHLQTRGSFIIWFQQQNPLAYLKE